MAEADRWVKIIPLARLFREDDAFGPGERDYKLVLAEAVAEVKSALVEGAAWQAALKQALRHPQNNLVAWRVVDDTLKLAEREPAKVAAALDALWGEGELRERMTRFLELLPTGDLAGSGAVLSVASFLALGSDDATDVAIYRAKPVRVIRRAASWPERRDTAPADLYTDWLDLVDDFTTVAREAGLDIRDRIDAQSVLYCIASWGPQDHWSTDERLALAAVLGEEMPGHLSLTKSVEEWDRSSIDDQLQTAAEQRAALLERFPATDWPELPLERYALGLPDSSDGYSYWIEFGTPRVGSIRGGSSMKHLIFKRKGAEGWYFESRYASRDEAWEEIRAGFVQLLEHAARGEFDEIDAIASLLSAPAVRAKTAWLYFPDQLLPIYSTQHLDYWLKIFGVEVASGVGPVGKNRRLFETVTALPEFEGWQPLEIMYFLYSWSRPDLSRTILKVAPGAQASLWQDCLENGYVRVGWDELGDLTQFETLEEIRDGLLEIWPDKTSSVAKREARALKWFTELEQGDIIVANHGTKSVVGIGRVVDGYIYREDLPDHRHTVDVDWYDTEEREVDFSSAWMPTIVKVSADEYHQIQHAAGHAVADELPLPSLPGVHLTAESLLERHGQAIFYGPPGTGKTYSARRHAVWMLLGGSTNPEAARAFGSQFAELERQLSAPPVTDERPSWLVVANPQRWKWQYLLDEGEVDYAYGKLQRNYEELMPGDEVFGYEATPTKRIVARARIVRGLGGDDPAVQSIVIGGGESVQGPTWDELQQDPVLSQSEPLSQRMQGTLFRLEPAEASRLRQLCGVAAGPTASAQIAQLTRVTFHPTYSYEDFIEGYKPTESGRGGLELQMRSGVFKRVCRAAAADPERPYVVLIDEINRGNVPKIFGELITLIERDKRGVTVSLPQSGETFFVPPNVHIIGTMNTADRSIHVLDAALRRRFGFVELLPDASVLEGATVGTMALDEFLMALNALVRQEIGREKQIGHALLMNGEKPIAGVDEFRLVFQYELLPLLQEYTYGDYRGLASLLGDEVIDTEAEMPRSEVLDEGGRLVTALATHLEIA